MRKQWALWVVAAAAVVLVTGAPALAEEAQKQTMSFGRMMSQATFGSVIGFLDIFVIFLLSITSIALIIEHGITIRRTVLLPEMSVAQIKTMFDEHRFREALEFCQADPSFVSGVVHAGLIEAANGYEAMERAMGDAAEERTARLYRKIEYLNLIGNISPMLGLFGTVYGMMNAFGEIAAQGGKADPADLAEGILLALFSTFVGLFVAIPSLAAYAIYRNRVEQLSMEAALVAEELLANFKPSAGGA